MGFEWMILMQRPNLLAADKGGPNSLWFIPDISVDDSISAFKANVIRYSSITRCIRHSQRWQQANA